MSRPSAESLSLFVNGLGAALTAYETNIAAERGRAGLRRLNAYEYENAACATSFTSPGSQIKSKLPQDGESGDITRLARRSMLLIFRALPLYAFSRLCYAGSNARKTRPAAYKHDSDLRAPGAVAPQLPPARGYSRTIA